MSQDFTIQFQRIKNAYFTLPVMGDFPKFNQHKPADFSSIFQRSFPVIRPSFYILTCFVGEFS